MPVTTAFFPTLIHHTLLSHFAMDYASKALQFTKKAFDLSVASTTNVLKARITRAFLHNVGRASDPTCPEGIVRLHQLCKACTLFTQRSVALSWLDDSNPRTDWPPQERYRLCTVAHLQRLNGRCHFCTVLYTFVGRVREPGRHWDIDKSWLYLEIQDDHKP